MPSDSSTEPRKYDPIQVLKPVAEVSILIGAALFVIGWSYLYAYFHGFGLTTSELGFTYQTVLIYSLAVIHTCKFLIGALLSTVILLIAYLILSYVRHPGYILLAAPVVLVLMASYSGKAGRDKARQDAVITTSTLPYVNLYGTADNGIIGCSLDNSDYRLLLRANGQIYVVLPIDSPEGEVSGSLRVCSFPESRIQAVRLQVGLEKKQ
jgi:hypothetical protein